MTPLRRYLRSFVMIWLVCQAAAVCAFGPAACCPAHQQAADGVEDCQGSADGACPMHASATEQGTAESVADAASIECPLHSAGVPPGSPSACAMRGMCNGPSVALSILFSVPGVLVQKLRVEASTITAVVRSESSRVLDIAAEHDTPPPRL